MSGSADDLDRGSAAAYLEHARWLLEWHNRRSEAATNRSVALLGFLGIILAAILQGAALLDGDLSATVWTLLILTGGALLFAAYFALQAIGVKPVRMQDIPALRRSWERHLAGGDGAVPSEYNIAESFLNSTGVDGGVTPVQAASDEARDRVKSFKRSVRFTAAALVLLALLAVSVAATSEGGEHEQQHERERKPVPRQQR